MDELPNCPNYLIAQLPHYPIPPAADYFQPPGRFGCAGSSWRCVMAGSHDIIGDQFRFTRKNKPVVTDLSGDLIEDDIAKVRLLVAQQ